MFWLALGSVLTSAIGAGLQYSAADEAQEVAEAQADYEKATTQVRVDEEKDRASQNLLRAEEEKRKELAKQRAAFVKAGVLPSSPSVDMVIGKLGENLQTRINDMFIEHSDRIASIQSQGNASYFNALQNASAAGRQKTGALIGGLTSLATKGYQGQKTGVWQSVYADYKKMTS